jgi:hypothetical protein
VSAPTPCTCGELAPHIVARRTTADGRRVEIYSDGYVLGPAGHYLPGVGRKRVPAEHLVAFASEVCLFTVAELGALVVEHQRAAKLEAERSRPIALHPNAIVGRGRPLLYPTRNR